MTGNVIIEVFVIIGASSSLDSVINFSDAMIFAMVFPNMIGLIFFAPTVKKEIKIYLSSIKNFYHQKSL